MPFIESIRTEQLIRNSIGAVLCISLTYRKSVRQIYQLKNLPKIARIGLEWVRVARSSILFS